jgi:hypothetical protein
LFDLSILAASPCRAAIPRGASPVIGAITSGKSGREQSWHSICTNIPGIHVRACSLGRQRSNPGPPPLVAVGTNGDS